MNRQLVVSTIGVAIATTLASLAMYAVTMIDDETTTPKAKPGNASDSTQSDWVDVTVGEELFPQIDIGQYTDWSEVDDPTEPEIDIIEIVDRKPAGVNVELQVGVSEPDILFWPVPKNQEEHATMNKALAKVGLNSDIIIIPTTYSNDVLVVLSKLVVAANGYLIELSSFMEFVINGRFDSGDVFLEQHTGLSLEQMVGTEAYAKVRAWGRAPSSMSLIGNMNVIYDWLKYKSTLPIEMVDTMTIRDVIALMSVCDNKSRDVLKSAHYVSKYLDGSRMAIADFISVVRRHTNKNPAAVAMRKAGIRDGGVFDYYGDSLKHYSQMELVSVLRTLGKFAVTDNRAQAVMKRFASTK